MQNSRGFTLIELMVTIAIVTILAMMTAPSMSNFIAQQQLNKSVRELAATLSQARSQAALLRRNITVNLDSRMVNTPTVFNWHPSGESIYKSTSITSLVFLSNGKVQTATNNAPDTSLKICDGNSVKAKTIVVSFMGTLNQTEGSC
jgi:type IV fimbrial biogenesis protein FimT